MWFSNLFRYIFSSVSFPWMKSINSLYLNLTKASSYLISDKTSFLNSIIRWVSPLLSLFYMASLSMQCLNDYSYYFIVITFIWSWLFYWVTREISNLNASGINLFVSSISFIDCEEPLKFSYDKLFDLIAYSSNLCSKDWSSGIVYKGKVVDMLYLSSLYFIHKYWPYFDIIISYQSWF